MKHKEGEKKSAEAEEREATAERGKATRRKRHRLRGWLIALGIVILILGVARALMPWAVRDYVNRTLDRNPLYKGSIGPIEIDLWRGAYAIHDVNLSKRTGDVPVPLFDCKRVEFAIQWHALIHRKIVGKVYMEQPQLNFVDAPTDADSQTGEGGPWLQMIRDLFPFKINSAAIHDGSVHFRSNKGGKLIDAFIGELNATVNNLGNIRNETKPMVATVDASGLVMNQAKLNLKMTLDPFSYKPTFHLVLRLLGLDVTKINDLALAYGKFDFKRGFFDLIVDATSEEGQLTGYVKPLFRDLKVFSLTQDLKEDSVLQFFWQALVGFVTTIFRNQPRDQFGTLIPFYSTESGQTTTDILATLGNLLKNAFIRAYLPRLEKESQIYGGLTFEPPDITNPVSPAESP